MFKAAIVVAIAGFFLTACSSEPPQLEKPVEKIVEKSAEKPAEVAAEKTADTQIPVHVLNASSTSVYIRNGRMLEGRKNDSSVNGFSDLKAFEIFGMNKDADGYISKLEFSKTYKCNVDGTKASVESTAGGTYVNMVKVYSISDCSEVNEKEALNSFMDQDKAEPPREPSND